ncbi:MAG TPA: hypothetical protein VGX72_15240 [Solirubrobacteraceae bacterium]|jgi:hypothetical protein|nr:hypothetical protein [Solirubrobacteraceae bacterium]
MHEPSSQTNYTAARLVVIDLLGQRRGRRRPTLYRHLRDHDRDAINAAITSLVGAGILTTSGDRLIATPALVCLESLDLIAI